MVLRALRLKVAVIFSKKQPKAAFLVMGCNYPHKIRGLTECDPSSRDCGTGGRATHFFLVNPPNASHHGKMVGDKGNGKILAAAKGDSGMT